MSMKTEYEQQCQRWHRELLPEFEALNTSNLHQRLNHIEKIVNTECNEYNISMNSEFEIYETQRDRLKILCNKDLPEHTFVSFEKCVHQMTNKNDYKRTARNKLNRWKPKIFGENVLYEIIYINIYNYCYTIGRLHEWDDSMILSLFITIFCKLLTAKIRFAKTRDVPLIIPTTLQENTKFRASCIALLQYFNALNSWNQRGGRAVAKRDSFKKCLERIGAIQNAAIPPPIIMDHMMIQENNRECGIIYKYIVYKFIVKFEDEARLNKHERISQHNYQAIMDIINEYHHYKMKFWTVTPPKLSPFALSQYQSNYDGDYSDNGHDDDGDIKINSNDSNGHHTNNNMQTTLDIDSFFNIPSYMNANSSNSALTANTPSTTTSRYSSNVTMPTSTTNTSFDREQVSFGREKSYGSNLTMPEYDIFPQLTDHGNDLFSVPMADAQPSIAGAADVGFDYTPSTYLPLPTSGQYGKPRIQLPRPPTRGDCGNYQPRNPHISQQLPPPPPPVMPQTFDNFMTSANDISMNNPMFVGNHGNNYNNTNTFNPVDNGSIFEPWSNAQINQQQQHVQTEYVQSSQQPLIQQRNEERVSNGIFNGISNGISTDNVGTFSVNNNNNHGTYHQDMYQPTSYNVGNTTYNNGNEYISNDYNNGNDVNQIQYDHNLSDIGHMNSVSMHDNAMNQSFNQPHHQQYDHHHHNQQQQPSQPQPQQQQQYYPCNDHINSHEDNYCVQQMQMDSVPMMYQNDVVVDNNHNNSNMINDIHTNNTFSYNLQNSNSQTMLFNNYGTQSIFN